MEKSTASLIHKKQNTRCGWMKRFTDRLEHLSAEDCFERLTAIMYRIILFLGVPYFLYVLWSFIQLIS